MNVVIPYKPRDWAQRLHESDKRWKVIVAHRRCGKSTAAFNHLQRDALQTKESRYAYIAPTYKQAKNIIWDIAKYYSRVIPGVEFNEAELTVKYPNGARITLYGADNPDSLRGIGLWGVVFDEYSQQPSNIFTEIIRPALADHTGYAIWIGTPKGRNEFFRLYERAKAEPEWLGMLLTVEDTGILSKEELEDARKQMSDDEFLQEFYCSFDASIKGAIFRNELETARKEKRITRVPYDASLPVFTVWDLGVGDATAIGFYQRASELRMIDYYESTGQGLPHYVKLLREKPYVYGKYFAPHDIAVREFSSGKSRLEIAKTLGIDFHVVPNLPIDDGINAARLAFRRLWIDEKCAQWIDYIGQYHYEWDDKRGVFKNTPNHDFTSHAADMWRYAALSEGQMTNEKHKEVIVPRPQLSDYQGDVGLDDAISPFQGIDIGKF